MKLPAAGLSGLDRCARVDFDHFLNRHDSMDGFVPSVPVADVTIEAIKTIRKLTLAAYEQSVPPSKIDATGVFQPARTKPPLVGWRKATPLKRSTVSVAATAPGLGGQGRGCWSRLRTTWERLWRLFFGLARSARFRYVGLWYDPAVSALEAADILKEAPVGCFFVHGSQKGGGKGSPASFAAVSFSIATVATVPVVALSMASTTLLSTPAFDAALWAAAFAAFAFSTAAVSAFAFSAAGFAPKLSEDGMLALTVAQSVDGAERPLLWSGRIRCDRGFDPSHRSFILVDAPDGSPRFASLNELVQHYAQHPYHVDYGGNQYKLRLKTSGGARQLLQERIAIWMKWTQGLVFASPKGPRGPHPRDIWETFDCTVLTVRLLSLLVMRVREGNANGMMLAPDPAGHLVSLASKELKQFREAAAMKRCYDVQPELVYTEVQLGTGHTALQDVGLEAEIEAALARLDGSLNS